MLTVDLRNKLLESAFAGKAYAPTEVYVALLDNSGNEINKSGYSRVVGDFDTASNGVIKNDSDIDFDVAQENWGTVAGLAIYDSQTGGNEMINVELNQSKVINTNDMLSFRKGDIEIKIGDCS